MIKGTFIPKQFAPNGDPTDEKIILLDDGSICGLTFCPALLHRSDFKEQDGVLKYHNEDEDGWTHTATITNKKISCNLYNRRSAEGSSHRIELRTWERKQMKKWISLLD